jgi:geranylgeranyl diphosphate synthase, type II
MQNIEYYQDLIESHIRNNPFQGSPAGLYEPVNYLMGLGGKRMRPVLLLMATELFGKPAEEAIEAALAIEVFHNFTLAHDDIMDEAPLRRGQETMHTKFGTNTAILGGDLMLIKAYELLTKGVPNDLHQDVLQMFSKTAIEICEGQQMDMEFETRYDLELDEYIQMIRLKTAVLLGASMYIGAIIGGAMKNEAEALYEFAVNLGIAFQIKDDFLDTYGDGDLVGKKIGGDILRKKKTFLWLTCRKYATQQDIQIMDDFDSSDEELYIRTITDLYSKYEVKTRTESAQNEWYQKALHYLDGLQHEGSRHQLYNFADMLMNRLF